MDAMYSRIRQICGSGNIITRMEFKENDKLFVKVVKKVFDIRHIAGVDDNAETRKAKEKNVENVLKLLKMVSMPTNKIRAKNVLDADIKLNDLIKELVSYYINRKIREYKMATNEDEPVVNFRMWINKILRPLHEISNFVPDFQNPIAFGALLNNVEPGLYENWETLTAVNQESTVDDMMKVAEDRFNIKPIIKARDIIGDKADEFTIVIYFSQFLELKNLLMKHFISKSPAEQGGSRDNLSPCQNDRGEHFLNQRPNYRYTLQSHSMKPFFPDECDTPETTGSSIGLGQGPWNAYRKANSQHNPSIQHRFPRNKRTSLDSGRSKPNLEDVPFENPSNEEEFWQILSNNGVNYNDKLRNSVINGHLEIGKTTKLGEGHFGSVYKGRFTHPVDGFKMCAVQTIKRSGVTLKDVQDFLNEAWITKSCNHENVIRLLNLTFSDGLPYLLFPFYKNGDLASYIKQNELGVDEMIKFALDVTNGAKYLNDYGYVHRLLTAEGCWVTDKKTVVLSNFELCRDILDGTYMMTSSGKGIPWRSAALEILKGGRKFDVKTDIWSLGVLFWVIFSGGKTPYEEAKDADQLIKHLQDGRRLPTLDLGSTIDKRLNELLIKCWNENPSCRPSHDEILFVLNQKTEGIYSTIS